MSDSDKPDDVVVLTRLADLTVARIVCGRLQAEGIAAYLPDEHTASQLWRWHGAVGGIRVQVRRADLERAQAILAQPAMELSAEAASDAAAPGAAPAGPEGPVDDGTISAGDRMAFRALRVTLVSLLLPGVVHPYSLWLAVSALGRPDTTSWGRWRAWVALLVSVAGCACLAFLAYRFVRTAR
ncbi:MAG: DUF2007 domain-containing protein [Deltaproteobacteria bacterium]|nr:DUF2007 domain-containing protein [Deltaproteobacteria bacterium]